MRTKEQETKGTGEQMNSTVFRPAVKSRAKLRLALIGPAGSGKTFTALAVACRMVGGQAGKVAVIDTEHGSAEKYADLFAFDTLHLESFSPARYVEAIAAAVAAGYEVIIVDSLTHAWSGKDGALERVDRAAARSKSSNSFAAWRDVTPEHQKMVEAIVGAGAHVICTMRSKTDYVQEKDGNGRTVIRKVGLSPVQRDGMEYEFDLVGDIDDQHTMSVTKSRILPLADAVIKHPGSNLAVTLLEWLNAGPAPVAVAPVAPVAPVFSPMASRDDLQGLVQLAGSLGIDKVGLASFVLEHIGKTAKDLTVSDIGVIITRLEANQ